MTNYAKFNGVLKLADNSSYDESRAHKLVEVTATPIEYKLQERYRAMIAGVTVYLDTYTSIDLLIVQYVGTTGTVTAACTNAAAAAVSQVLAPGDAIMLCDVGVASNLTLTGSADNLACEVTILGQ